MVWSRGEENWCIRNIRMRKWSSLMGAEAKKWNGHPNWTGNCISILGSRWHLPHYRVDALVSLLAIKEVRHGIDNTGNMGGSTDFFDICSSNPSRKCAEKMWERRWQNDFSQLPSHMVLSLSLHQGNRPECRLGSPLQESTHIACTTTSWQHRTIPAAATPDAWLAGNPPSKDGPSRSWSWIRTCRWRDEWR